MKTNNYRSHNRRKTPWDSLEDDELSDLQLFIKNEYKSHYYEHHPLLINENEASFLNSYTPAYCKHCGSTNFKKNGFNSYSIQTYYCKDCGRKFTILTNTIFDDHKISLSEWIEYLLNLFGYSSINLNSKTNKNSPTTSKYWLAKVFLVLKDYQDSILLKGKTYIDETYFSVEAKDIKYKNNGKKYKGLSRNKICIASAKDKNNIFLIVKGKGKISSKKALDAYGPHIKEGSTIIHDDEKAHNILIERNKLKSISYNSNDLKKLNDKENPLYPINRVHYFFKRFLDSHPGFNRNELQGYANLFVFMNNTKGNKLNKVEAFIELALKSNTQRLRYRDYYVKKKR